MGAPVFSSRTYSGITIAVPFIVHIMEILPYSVSVSRSVTALLGGVTDWTDILRQSRTLDGALSILTPQLLP